MSMKAQSAIATMTEEEKAALAPDREELLKKPSAVADRWPAPLASAAFHGLPGDIVRTIEPHTEADPVALLIQMLVAFGNAIGRNAYYQVEADQHYANIYVVLVGNTSKGRKGTSKSHVMRLMRSVDEQWATERAVSGLSSGEGLIWAVRDLIEKQEAIKENSRVTGYRMVTDDPGIEDKRLLVTESELASTLRVLGRDGNTLSAVVRDAWDHGNLRTLVKNSPAKATDAHISIIGHITATELLRYLDNTEAANGFANRFLWVCVRRSKCLPEGGNIEAENFDLITRRLKQALDFARVAGRLKWSAEARESWYKVYPNLSDGQPGLLGAVTGRAEAQVVRLALLYALLDCSPEIRQAHLAAALAIWDYCDESVFTIFGDRMGDPIADEILAALRSSGRGLTRTQISGLFNRHAKAERISQALDLLSRQGKIRPDSIGTDGRTAECWYAV
jgi:hypothetical protein